MAKTAYVASIQAWRLASHPFVQISLQNLQFVLRKLGKESAAARIADFCIKKKREWSPEQHGSSCQCHH